MMQDAFDLVFEALCNRLSSEEFYYLKSDAEIKSIDREKHNYRIAIEEIIKQHTEISDILKEYMRVHSSYRDRQEMGMYIRGIKSVFDELIVKEKKSSHDEKPVDEALISQSNILEMIKGMENVDESLKNKALILGELEAEIMTKPDINNKAVMLLEKYIETDARTWDQWCVHVYEIGINDCKKLLNEYGLFRK